MKTYPQKQQSSTKKKEHSIKIRSKALAYWEKGDSYRSIGKQLGISYSTVQKIILKFKKTGLVINKKRPGHPLALTPEAKKNLKLTVLSNRESRIKPLGEIVKEFNSMLTKEVSESTVKRALKDQGIKCHTAAIKPFINEVNAARRVAWCKERLDWEIKDWEKVCINSFILVLYLFFNLVLHLFFIFI